MHYYLTRFDSTVIIKLLLIYNKITFILMLKPFLYSPMFLSRHNIGFNQFVAYSYSSTSIKEFLDHLSNHHLLKMVSAYGFQVLFAYCVLCF
jgi:hypothetical protein